MDNDEVVEAADDGRHIELPNIARVDSEFVRLKFAQTRNERVDVRALRHFEDVRRVAFAFAVAEFEHQLRQSPKLGPSAHSEHARDV